MEKFLSVTCQDLQRESRDKGVDELPVPSLAKQIVNLSQACSQEGVRLLNQDGLVCTKVVCAIQNVGLEYAVFIRLCKLLDIAFRMSS